MQPETRYTSHVTTTDLPAERYALLIEQLGEELGFKRGWMSAVAKKLGVHRSYISRIHGGDRSGIGVQVIDRAIERLGIRSAFFFRALPEPPHYVDYTPLLGEKEWGFRDPIPRDTKNLLGWGSKYWVTLGARARLAIIALNQALKESGDLKPEADQTGVSETFNHVLLDLAGEVMDMPVFAYAEQIRHSVESGGSANPTLAAVFLSLVVEEGHAQQLLAAQQEPPKSPFDSSTLRIARAAFEEDPSFDADARRDAIARIDKIIEAAEAREAREGHGKTPPKS